MTRTSRRAWFAALSLSAVLPLGCSTASDNGGLTNGPPPTSSGAKAADRTDLPDAPLPDRGETAGKIENTGNDAGSAARGGGDNPDIPKSTADVIDKGSTNP